MKIIFRPMVTLSLVSLLFTVTAQAALFDRGGGLIYDDVLDVTWLQDVSYVQNHYSSANHAVNWATANSWVSGLEYQDSVRNTVWTDWRLPEINPAYTGWEGSSVPTDSPTEYHIYDRSESGANELAYMYYVNLGFDAYTDPITDPGAVPLPTSDIDNPFENLYYLGTWTGNQLEDPTLPNSVWYFHFHFGQTLLDASGGGDTQTVWAVRDGDVGLGTSPVPVPPAFWLMGSTLVLFGFLSNKKGNTPAKA
ncbi:MAG: hypothetical protein ABW170_09255 [Candidatus Thiodiazotropha sp. L084R]